MSPRAITVAILAMGGEGGGVLADWIVDLAERGGYYAQATSVPGVAQRTGSTIYYVELFPESAGKDPVLALMPVPGEVDIVIASELMEAGRAVQRGLVTPDRTTLVASTHRVYSMTERTAPGDGRVDAEKLFQGAQVAAKRIVSADFAAIAHDAGSVISAALFGALAATKSLPFDRGQFEDAIRRGGVGVDASLRAFAAGWEAVGTVAPAVEAEPEIDVVQVGVERLKDYQDERYADEYLELLAPLRGLGLFREAARHLALWMSYEDAIRVAELKIRAARFERVRTEARAAPEQIVRIHEYLHPRVAELADILPAALGRRLMAPGLARSVVERFTRKGKVLETTSLRGFLQLFVLARLRRWRRRSLRFEREQRRIREWLALVVSLAAENYALACEWAECPRLLKGYGDTHARGCRNFDALGEALIELRQSPYGAARLKQLREAALSDEHFDVTAATSR